MSKYSARLLDHFSAPRNPGAMPDADAIGRGSRDGRAPYTNFYIKVHEGRITHASFETFGCGVSIACASVLTELAIGRGLQEAMSITPAQVRAALDGVPSEKAFCADIAVCALRNALEQLQQ